MRFSLGLLFLLQTETTSLCRAASLKQTLGEHSQGELRPNRPTTHESRKLSEEWSKSFKGSSLGLQKHDVEGSTKGFSVRGQTLQIGSLRSERAENTSYSRPASLKLVMGYEIEITQGSTAKETSHALTFSFSSTSCPGVS